MAMRFRFLTAIVAVAWLIAVSPASAQTSVSYISALKGNETSNCAAAYPSGSDEPCLTPITAMSKTRDGGTLVCADPGDHIGGFNFSSEVYDTVITKGLTIDCQAGGGARDYYSVVINAPGKTVSLRNLTVNPSLSRYANDAAIRIIAAASVELENVVVTGANNAGILDNRSVSGKLAIRNSVVVGHSGPGIVIAPQGGVTISAILENVSVRDSNYGLAVAAGGRVMVRSSVFAQNFTAGIEGDPGSFIEIKDTLISNNPTGVMASAGSTITLANTGVNSNNTALSGPTRSYGTNRFFANAISIGTAPTPVGGASSENGLR